MTDDADGVRFKPVPDPPADRSGLAAASRAVPLVPGSEDDCCARLGRRLDLPRDEARTWLTFLRALGLAERTGRGFVRTGRDPEGEAVVAAFRDRVFGAREVLAALEAADESLTAGATFERVADAVPAWERGKAHDWRATWGERVAALLDWAVLFGLADRDGDRYRRP